MWARVVEPIKPHSLQAPTSSSQACNTTLISHYDIFVNYPNECEGVMLDMGKGCQRWVLDQLPLKSWEGHGPRLLRDNLWALLAQLVGPIGGPPNPCWATNIILGCPPKGVALHNSGSKKVNTIEWWFMKVVPRFFACTTPIVAAMGSHQGRRRRTTTITIGLHHHVTVMSYIPSGIKLKICLSFLGV